MMVGEARETWIVTHRVVAEHALGEPGANLEALSTQECQAYLAQGGLGRVAFAVGGVAIVLPVNYAVLAAADADPDADANPAGHDEIVFLTSSGSKLRAVESGCVVTFEVDHFGENGAGWSVLATGPARTSSHPGLIHLVRDRGVIPHGAVAVDHVVGIEVRFVTGRRFGSPSTHRPLHQREP